VINHAGCRTGSEPASAHLAHSTAKTWPPHAALESLQFRELPRGLCLLSNPRQVGRVVQPYDRVEKTREFAGEAGPAEAAMERDQRPRRPVCAKGHVIWPRYTAEEVRTLTVLHFYCEKCADRWNATPEERNSFLAYLERQSGDVCPS
jgi:hypothetical protein